MAERTRLTPAFLWLLAVAAGLSVANLYYVQPLLPDIARAFGVGATRVGEVATATQVGYAIGLLLFVPLGDVIDRRRLVLALLAAVTVALLAVSAAPTLTLLAIGSLAVGITTVVPQVLLPLAAGLAAPAERGRVVGRIVSGILVGILAARGVAGVVGRLSGWRAMFVVAAALMLVLALALMRWLPSTPPATGTRPTYGALLRSLVTLAREQPVLRDAAVLGALFFAAFSAFWTTLAFRLATPPLHHGAEVAGAFGLLGITGAFAAPIAGRFADRGSPRTAVGVAIAVNAVAWALFLLVGHTLWGIAAGVVLIDAGTQAAQVSNQSRIYALPAGLHARLNTVFMVTYFCGGAIGSVLGAWAWGTFGWAGVCAVGFGALGLALVRYLWKPGTASL